MYNSPKKELIRSDKDDNPEATTEEVSLSSSYNVVHTLVHAMTRLNPVRDARVSFFTACPH